jgi:hypothetical protein
MRDAPEIVCEQIGVDANGTPIFGPPGTIPTYDENAIQVAPFWQGALAFIGTAIAIVAAYPGA